MAPEIFRLMCPSFYYYSTVAAILEPFVGQSDKNTGLPSRTAEEDLRLKDRVEVTKICSEMLLRLYFTHHGFEQLDSILSSHAFRVGLHALSNMKVADEMERTGRLSTALLCIKGLREQARNYYLAEVLFHQMRSFTGEDITKLLVNLVDIEDEEHRKGLVAKYIRSSWAAVGYE
jgi:hypothetical protein